MNPGVARVVAVMEFATSQPDRRFTLSELCRRLDIAKGTAHPLLASLTELGWLSRDPVNRTFGVGPGLVALSDAASAHRQQLIETVRPIMDELSDRTGLPSVASTVIGTDIVMLAVSGSPRPFGTSLQPGQRVPFEPPLGTVFVAWSAEEQVERWLAAHDHPRARAAVEAVRTNGVSIGVESPTRQLLGDAISRGERPDAVLGELRTEEYWLLDLEHTDRCSVSVIAAPVFSAQGEVTIAVSLFDLPPSLGADEIAELSHQLVLCADEVTKRTGGTRPGGTHG